MQEYIKKRGGGYYKCERILIILWREYIHIYAFTSLLVDSFSNVVDSWTWKIWWFNKRFQINFDFHFLHVHPSYHLPSQEKNTNNKSFLMTHAYASYIYIGLNLLLTPLTNRYLFINPHILKMWHSALSNYHFVTIKLFFFSKKKKFYFFFQKKKNSIFFLIFLFLKEKQNFIQILSIPIET
jgi:hypothetical protein